MTNEPQAREGSGAKPSRIEMSKRAMEIDVKPGLEQFTVRSFDTMKITMLTRQRSPLPSGTRRVYSHLFLVECESIDPLLVKRLEIETVNLKLDYTCGDEIDLPEGLEVGMDGVLQKTIHGHFAIQVVSYVEKEKAEVKAVEAPVPDYSTYEYEPNKEAVVILPFDQVKIKVLTKQGTPIPSGARRVFGDHFEVEAPGVDKLIVKRVHIVAAGVTFNYEGPSERALPSSLEVGADGILLKTVYEILPVRIISRVVKVRETPESEVVTKSMDGPPKCSRCHVPGHSASECKLLPPPGTSRG